MHAEEIGDEWNGVCQAHVQRLHVTQFTSHLNPPAPCHIHWAPAACAVSLA